MKNFFLNGVRLHICKVLIKLGVLSFTLVLLLHCRSFGLVSGMSSSRVRALDPVLKLLKLKIVIRTLCNFLCNNILKDELISLNFYDTVCPHCCMADWNKKKTEKMATIFFPALQGMSILANNLKCICFAQLCYFDTGSMLLKEWLKWEWVGCLNYNLD